MSTLRGRAGKLGRSSKTRAIKSSSAFRKETSKAARSSSAFIPTRMHAPQAQSGEIIIWTKFQKSGGSKPDAASGGQGGNGQQIYLKNDGSVTVTDGNGATIVLDGSGNVAITCNNFTVNASGNVGINGSNLVEIYSPNNVGIDAGGLVTVGGGGSVSGTSVNAPSPQPTIPPFSVPG